MADRGAFIEDSHLASYFLGYQSDSDCESDYDIDYLGLNTNNFTSNPDDPVITSTENPQEQVERALNNNDPARHSDRCNSTTTTNATLSYYCKTPITQQGETVQQNPQDEDNQFGCKCKASCVRQFSKEQLLSHKLNCLELSTKELDLVVVSKLQALCNTDELTVGNHRKPKERRKAYTNYLHCGKEICRDLFLNLHCLGKERLTNLLNHLRENGVSVRQKKSGGRNKLALTRERCEGIYSYLTNLAEEIGVKLPGRIPGNYSSKSFPSNYLLINR